MNLCSYDTRKRRPTRNDLGDHRMWGQLMSEKLKQQLESTQAENVRLKEALQDAIELLTENNINTLKLWRT